MTKICTKCETEKPLIDFHKDKNKKDGHSSLCKDCKNNYRKKHYKENSEVTKEKEKERYYLDVEKSREKSRKYRKNNLEKEKLRFKTYFKNNTDKENAKKARRRAAKLQRTVGWVDLDKIKKFYTEAKRLTRETGIQHHVDHIIPLRGDNVSGLHVENNLQVITAEDNLSKGNKFIY